MRIWRATDGEKEEFFYTITNARHFIEETVGKFAPAIMFEGVQIGPERWEWEYEDGVWMYAEWRVEPVSVK